MTRRLYHFETLLLTLLISGGAYAQNPPIKPQGPSQPWPQSGDPAAGVPQPPLMGAVAPGASIPGRPVILPVVPQAPAQQQDQESQALQNAFQQILSTMGGGANGRSEFGRPGYEGGDNYGAGYRGGTGSSTPVGANDLSGPRRIIPPFKKWFSECTKKYGDCKFQNWGIMGDSNHRARRSCHNAGEAIDVGPITCSGGQSFDPKGKSAESREEFFNIAKCMANDSHNELQVIFHRAAGSNMMQKSDHAGHMHVQLKNCNMTYGQ